MRFETSECGFVANIQDSHKILNAETLKQLTIVTGLRFDTLETKGGRTSGVAFTLSRRILLLMLLRSTGSTILWGVVP